MEQLTNELTALVYNLWVTNKSIELLVIEPGYYYYPLEGERVTVKISSHKNNMLTSKDIILEFGNDNITIWIERLDISYEVEIYFKESLHDKYCIY